MSEANGSHSLNPPVLKRVYCYRKWDDFEIGAVLGKGAFGLVRRLTPIKYPLDPHLAFKYSFGGPDHDDMLLHEWEIGSKLCNTIRRRDLPIIFYSALSTFHRRPCIVMEEGLMTAQQFLSRKSRETDRVKAICQLAPQLIRRLEQFHGFGFIHRDVKMSNFILIPSTSDWREDPTVRLSDLGLATRYLGDAGRHISIGETKYAGTPLYSSKNADRGLVQSRRDDMESLAYSLIDAALPTPFPWQGVSFDALRVIKAETSPADICVGLPPIFAEYLAYCSQLEFEEPPDYGHWIHYFDALGKSYDLSGDSLPSCEDIGSSGSSGKQALSVVASSADPRLSIVSRGQSSSVSGTKDERQEKPKAARQVPNFARPTLSQLVRQKPPVRRTFKKSGRTPPPRGSEPISRLRPAD